MRITLGWRRAEAIRWLFGDGFGHLIEATSDTGAFMTFSACLKRSAVKLSKICNDLRLLSSGPQAGFAELNLPPRLAGSSIMPGKVNPVIPEVVNQVAFVIIGTDATVTAAAEAGQLQLNAFEPIMAHSILQSISLLRATVRTSRGHRPVGPPRLAERPAKSRRSGVVQASQAK